MQNNNDVYTLPCRFNRHGAIIVTTLLTEVFSILILLTAFSSIVSAITKHIELTIYDKLEQGIVVLCTTIICAVSIINISLKAVEVSRTVPDDNVDRPYRIRDTRGDEYLAQGIS